MKELKRRSFLKAALAVMVAPSLPVPQTFRQMISVQGYLMHKGYKFEINRREDYHSAVQLYTEWKGHFLANLMDIGEFYNNPGMRNRLLDSMVRAIERHRYGR